MLSDRLLSAPPVVWFVRWLAGRWPEARVATSSAYHVGAAVARTGELMWAPIRSGSSLLLDVRDHAHRQIAFFGTYEAPTTALMARLASPGWTFVDVGANCGYFSLYASDLGGRSASVHSFEPNRVLAAMERESVERSNATQTVTVNEMACGSERGVATFHYSPDAGEFAFSTMKAELAWSPEWKTSSVEVIDLDAYCLERGLRPDVVKLDAEGYEPEVLSGMTRLLAAGTPKYLICEVIEAVAGRADPAAVIDQMKEYGYTAHSITEDGGLGPADRRAPIDNLCFVAPGSPTRLSLAGDGPPLLDRPCDAPPVGGPQ